MIVIKANYREARKEVDGIDNAGQWMSINSLFRYLALEPVKSHCLMLDKALWSSSVNQYPKVLTWRSEKHPSVSLILETLLK